MAESGNPSLRIDWFDGSVIENNKPPRSASFEEEQSSTADTGQKPAPTERKPIGFKRLLDFSLMEPDKLILEISYRPGFWNLFDQADLKGDFLVLIVNTLDSIFKTIHLGEANTKIIKQLETRFLDSNFLEMLTDYLSTLPSVKIVEKKKNIHLWDDVEGFFFKVVSLCEGIVNFRGKKNEELSEKLDKLLKVLRISAIGVAHEHSERISDELFERISRLERDLNLGENLPTTKISEEEANFRSLNIFPTKEDIFVPETASSNNQDVNGVLKNIKIAPAINNGAYRSVEHYLDIQFRLLREDFFGPLREGINALSSICDLLVAKVDQGITTPLPVLQPTSSSVQTLLCSGLKGIISSHITGLIDEILDVPANILGVHQEVRILGAVVKNNRVGHLVDLAWKERSSNSKVTQKLYNKQLMFGSLLLFTSDEFQTILCATVLDSDMKMLRDGYVTVSFQNPVSKDILYSTYLMVESEVFFEPYHQVLKVLQSKTDKLPMQKYIVDVKTEVHPPAYLTQDTIYTIKKNKSEISFPVLDTNRWPTKHMDLEESQLEAFKFALTREFAVIQGPPGTGKTFLGLKIASTILENLSLKDTPMLVICFTNNALDQFLEGILKVTDKVVRLGSQSKSSKLEPYNLKNVRYKLNLKHRGFNSARKELEIIYNEMTALQSEIDICETGIVCYRNVKDYLKIDNKKYELKYFKHDRVFDWLFEHLEDLNPQESREEDSWENFGEMISDKGIIEECFSEKIAMKQIENIKNTIKQLADLNVDVEKNPERIEIFKREAEKIRKRLQCFKKYMGSHKKTNNEYKIDKVDDLYSLSTKNRWQMYFNAINRLRDELLTKMDCLLAKHKAVTLELEDLSTQIDIEVVRKARVVGVTTSAAARRHQLLIKMKSPIVIIEEAAEVLEAHIISSLTSSLQHLILIGDHKQLRPSAANYRLAKECNLEVSLFERMICNGIHARTLTTQRRMRPNIAQLLVPEVYLKLDSHETVFKYDDVKGMEKNLYFMTHEVFEDSEGSEESTSHENSFEAQWCVALAQYLLKQGYTSNEVTVLTTYSGQVTLIKKLSQNIGELDDVKITTVDNFQGEESRIVILSLVRSNRDGNIGFLSATNRICVALSRAKEGFYIIGNMSMLARASPIWMSINKKLIAQDAIGDTLCTKTPFTSQLLVD